MSKITSSNNTTNKTTFGSRKKGKSQKSYNKHNRSEKNYRGQGR